MFAVIVQCGETEFKRLVTFVHFDGMSERNVFVDIFRTSCYVNVVNLEMCESELCFQMDKLDVLSAQFGQSPVRAKEDSAVRAFDC